MDIVPTSKEDVKEISNNTMDTKDTMKEDVKELINTTMDTKDAIKKDDKELIVTTVTIMAIAKEDVKDPTNIIMEMVIAHKKYGILNEDLTLVTKNVILMKKHNTNFS